MRRAALSNPQARYALCGGLPLRRGFIKDDRGTPRPIVPFESSLPGEMDEEKRRRLRTHSWKDSLSPTWQEREGAAPWFVAFVPGIVGLVVFLPPVEQFLRQYLPAVLAIWLPILLGVLFIAYLVYVMVWARTRKHALLYLRAGYCGSCGHDLRGLTPESDGCTICAECGAAWKLA